MPGRWGLSGGELARGRDEIGKRVRFDGLPHSFGKGEAEDDANDDGADIHDAIPMVSMLPLGLLTMIAQSL